MAGPTQNPGADLAASRRMYLLRLPEMKIPIKSEGWDVWLERSYWTMTSLADAPIQSLTCCPPQSSIDGAEQGSHC